MKNTRKKLMQYLATMLSKKKEAYEKKKYSKGGRVNLKGGGFCKKGMNKKAIGRKA